MQLDNSSFTLPNKRNAVLERLIECHGETCVYPARKIFLTPGQKLQGVYYRNLLGGLYRENPVKSRNYEAVKSSKKWENVGNSYIIPALLLYRYSYI